MRVEVEDLGTAMENIECQYEKTDLYWSKEGDTYSLYSQSQEAYSKPLAVIKIR